MTSVRTVRAPTVCSKSVNYFTKTLKHFIFHDFVIVTVCAKIIKNVWCDQMRDFSCTILALRAEHYVEQLTAL